MELTKEEMHNLLIFLDRVTLTGKEATAYVTLIAKLNTILKEEAEQNDNN